MEVSTNIIERRSVAEMQVLSLASGSKGLRAATAGFAPPRT